MKNFKQKIKSYSFWTGLSAAVVMLANAIGKACGFTIDNQVVEDVIMSICGVLVALGIVCMPIKVEENDENTLNLDDEEFEDKDENLQENNEKIDKNK